MSLVAEIVICDRLIAFVRLTRLIDLPTASPLSSDHMDWLRLVASLKLQVSFAKEPYKRDNILQKRPIILRSLLIVANP